jgi:hypothetical protein
MSSHYLELPLVSLHEFHAELTARLARPNSLDRAERLRRMIRDIETEIIFRDPTILPSERRGWI